MLLIYRDKGKFMKFRNNELKIVMYFVVMCDIIEVNKRFFLFVVGEESGVRFVDLLGGRLKVNESFK